MLWFLDRFKKKITFNDGSYIEWRDRETISYCENNRICLIWVDYFENTFLDGGRLVHEKSIEKWKIKNIEQEVLVSESEKSEILEKVKKYYQIKKIPVRIEP